MKEAMVDMLTALRGTGMVDCKQRLRGGNLLRLLAVIEERNADAIQVREKKACLLACLLACCEEWTETGR